MTITQLQERIQRNPALDFSDIFGRAINLFQKVWLQGLLLQLLRLLVQYGVSMALYIPMLGSSFVLTSIEEGSAEGIGFIIWVIFMGLLYLLVILAVTIFSIGLELAFYRQVRLKERNLREKGVNFGMFFKKPHIRKVIYFSLAQLGITLAAVLLCVVPLFYVLVPLQFANIIFAFHPQFSLKEVYNLAFSLGNKKWFITFGLVVVSAILALVLGILGCFIAIYVTLSFVYLPAYLVYKDVVGFTEDDEAIASIGASFS